MRVGQRTRPPELHIRAFRGTMDDADGNILEEVWIASLYERVGRFRKHWKRRDDLHYPHPLFSRQAALQAAREAGEEAGYSVIMPLNREG